MTTPGPRCKPPANNIIEPLTFTTDEMTLRGKMVLSQSDLEPLDLNVNQTDLIWL